MTTLISGPTIGKLCGRTRKWAHEHLHRGSFGPITRGRGGVLYAEVDAVEDFVGARFTDEQLAAATARTDKPLACSPSRRCQNQKHREAASADYAVF